MARVRSPERDKAFEIYKKNKGNIDLIKIADILGVTPGTIRGWKNKDKWQDKLNGTFQKNKNTERSKKSVPKEKKIKKVVKEKQVEEIVTKVLKNSELTDKQRLFCLYYTRCFNATKAYQKAYECDYLTANAHGYKMLLNVVIREEIEKIKHNKFNKEMLSIDDILQKYIDIAFSDLGDYLSFKRVRKNKWKKNDKGQDIPVINPDTGEQDYFEYNTVELNDSKEVDTSILQEISEGKDGVKIKLQDKMKALDFLSKHLGLLDMATKEKLDLAREKFEYEKTKLAEVEEENDGSLKEMLEGFRNEQV